MATASVTNNFVNGTTADADDVDQNFQDLVDFLNNDVVHEDGTNGTSYLQKFLQVRKTGTTNISNGALTTVTWQAEDVDDWGGWTSGTNVSITTTGLYEVKGSARWQSSSTSAREMMINVNSTEVLSDRTTGVSGIDLTQHASRLITLTNGDVVTMTVEQNSGTTLVLKANTYLSLTLLRAS